MSTGPRSIVLAIVDDDESVQSALRDLVESEGLSAHCFGSAEQFLDSTVRHDASCLIADIRMPGMSGLELQTKLKAERCRIPDPDMGPESGGPPVRGHKGHPRASEL
jgi:FixJ family two-component response regulator